MREIFVFNRSIAPRPDPKKSDTKTYFLCVLLILPRERKVVTKKVHFHPLCGFAATATIDNIQLKGKMITVRA